MSSANRIVLQTAVSLLVVCTVVTLTVPSPLVGQASRRLESDIRFLADDLLEGRGTPGRGLDIAALYLATQLRAAGWEPGVGDSYFQIYRLRDFSKKQAHFRISLNGVELDPGDFIFLPFGLDPDRKPAEYGLVFAGHAVVAQERNLNALAGIDVAGKAVVALRGALWALDMATPMGYDHALGKSIAVTTRKGSLLIYVTGEFNLSPESPPSAERAFFREMEQVDFAYLPDFRGQSTMGLGPILVIPPRIFDRALAGLTGGTYSQWQERLLKEPFKARELPVSISIQVDVEPRESEAQNVVAVLRGSDAELRNEWVVLTAHYDHLGYHEVSPGEDGIWNGADDNASGTAAVLEVARHLSAQERAPRRSVLVLFTSGEDRGLLGSAHYSGNPVIPYERVAVNINLDMLGRSTGSVQAIAPGAPELFRKAVESGSNHGITVQPDQQPSWRILYLVDSYHFARFGVPAVEFFTGLHEDYHQPTDEADRIRYEELSRILRAITEVVDYYSQGGTKPTFQRPAWFLTPE